MPRIDKKEEKKLVITQERVEPAIGDTLLWDNRRILGKPKIVLARQAQPTHDYQRLIGYNRIYSASIVSAQEQLI